MLCRSVLSHGAMDPLLSLISSTSEAIVLMALRVLSQVVEDVSTHNLVALSKQTALSKIFACTFSTDEQVEIRPLFQGRGRSSLKSVNTVSHNFTRHCQERDTTAVTSSIEQVHVLPFNTQKGPTQYIPSFLRQLLLVLYMVLRVNVVLLAWKVSSHRHKKQLWGC